ncbi:MAG: hypothetical protein AB8B55_02785 [Mariniblastus sp.]
MKFSQHPDYRTAVFASTEGNFAEAREAYERLLDEAENNDDEVAISFLLQSLGNIEARDGNIELAHKHHLSAIGQSDGVPLNVIQYAKALANYFALPDRALEKLNEAELMLNSSYWDQTKDNISREDYEKLIAETREDLTAK